MTQNTTHGNTTYIDIGYSVIMSLERGKGVGEEININRHREKGMQSRKRCPSHKFFFALFSVT